jgi:excisionase family DNA binding protein
LTNTDKETGLRVRESVKEIDSDKLDVPETSERPVFLTIEEARSIIRVSRATFYRLMDRQEIPGVSRFGSSVRVHRETFERWMLGTPPSES